MEQSEFYWSFGYVALFFVEPVVFSLVLVTSLRVFKIYTSFAVLELNAVQ